jgi:two-component system response regulator DesR
MYILLGIAQAEFRLSLELLLSQEPGVTITGETSETEGLLALIHTTHPDLAIIEQDLPGRPLANLLVDIHALEDSPRLIVLGKDYSDKQTVLNAGADAFVVKGDPPEMLLAAFRRVSAQSRSST